MKRIAPSLFVVLIALGGLLLLAQDTSAQRGMPPDQPQQGLVYGGLELPNDGSCPHAFRVKGVKARGGALCTHGPDGPAAAKDLGAHTAPLAATSLTTVCDGDGASGFRFQVLYAHASDVLDRLSAYQTSFQQWASDADAIFSSSAAETGGARRVRFVHDAACAPLVLDVTLSTSGDDTFANLVGELQAQGYNRADRNYLVFVDAAVYCGLGSVLFDDSPGANNQNNFGPGFARIDAGCWSGASAAHEMMHTLGGVQLSAPHSSGGWHCVDEWDRMCYSDAPNYPVVQTLCPDSAHELIFDCNHDDYFSTNPPAGSYLATHWNAANNQFLIGAALPATPTPAATASRTPTHAPTRTPTRTPTLPAATPTATAALTVSATVTATTAQSGTPTRTPTQKGNKPTPTATRTPSIPATATPTATPLASATATPTLADTPPPTATP